MAITEEEEARETSCPSPLVPSAFPVVKAFSLVPKRPVVEVAGVEVSEVATKVGDQT